MTDKQKLTPQELDELFALADAVRNAAFEYAKVLHTPLVPGAIAAAGRANTDAYLALVNWVYEHADLGTESGWAA